VLVLFSRGPRTIRAWWKKAVRHLRNIESLDALPLLNCYMIVTTTIGSSGRTSRSAIDSEIVSQAISDPAVVPLITAAIVFLP
jgi:hypothetical protein